MLGVECGPFAIARALSTGNGTSCAEGEGWEFVSLFIF